MGTSTQIQPEGYYGHEERNQEPAVRKGLGEKEERGLSSLTLVSESWDSFSHSFMF